MPLKIQALHPCAHCPHPLLCNYGRKSKNKPTASTTLSWTWFCQNVLQRLLPCFGHTVPAVWTLITQLIAKSRFTWITPWSSHCSPLPRSNPCSILPDFHCDLPDSSQPQGEIKSIYFSTPSSSSFILIEPRAGTMSSPAIGHHQSSPGPFGHRVSELLEQALQWSAWLCHGLQEQSLGSV